MPGLDPGEAYGPDPHALDHLLRRLRQPLTRLSHAYAMALVTTDSGAYPDLEWLESPQFRVVFPERNNSASHLDLKVTTSADLLDDVCRRERMALTIRRTGVGMSQHGYWRVSDNTPVTAAEARERWARAAYPVLLDVARTYHAVITYKELAEKIQESTGIRTRTLLQNWIGTVLSKVVREAHRRGDPPLTSLVVHTDDGMVGEGYKEVLEVAGEPPVDDVMERELHAARSRLECYRRFCPTLPPDGGVPALAPRHQAAVDRRRERPARPPRFCSRCFMQLPSTGVCDSCDS